jgi:hypothetical protein
VLLRRDRRRGEHRLEERELTAGDRGDDHVGDDGIVAVRGEHRVQRRIAFNHRKLAERCRELASHDGRAIARQRAHARVHRMPGLREPRLGDADRRGAHVRRPVARAHG